MRHWLVANLQSEIQDKKMVRECYGPLIAFMDNTLTPTMFEHKYQNFVHKRCRKRFIQTEFLSFNLEGGVEMYLKM